MSDPESPLDAATTNRFLDIVAEGKMNVLLALACPRGSREREKYLTLAATCAVDARAMLPNGKLTNTEDTVIFVPKSLGVTLRFVEKAVARLKNGGE